MEAETVYDVLIVGGSVAGLSAALVLGRSLRRVLVIDSGEPCNRQTPHSHSFMTRDGVSPSRLTALAREQALAYPTVSFRAGRVTALARTDKGFVLTTDQGEELQARKVLLATGLEDLMPPIDGFAACWGRSVLHCPYCHGYEVRDQALGVMVSGERVLEYAGLIHHWSRNLMLFTNGADLTDEQRDGVLRLRIPVIETPIQRIRHQQGMLSMVEFTDGRQVALTAMFAPMPVRQHSDLAQQAGCAFTDTGLIVVSILGETSVPGLFAAGDNSSPMRQLSMASASGGAAGAGINRSLVAM